VHRVFQVRWVAWPREIIALWATRIKPWVEMYSCAEGHFWRAA
jgi:hypothetical protein